MSEPDKFDALMAFLRGTANPGRVVLDHDARTAEAIAVRVDPEGTLRLYIGNRAETHFTPWEEKRLREILNARASGECSR